jgi:hypothetical protein
MKIRIKYIIALLVLGVLVKALPNLIYDGIMNYQGYCFEKNRYLTFDDKIKYVFNVINHYDKVYIDNKPTQFKPIPYNSYEEFLRENPGCCSITPMDRFINPVRDLILPSGDFIYRITGIHSGEVVTVNYRLNYFGRDGKLAFEEGKSIRVLTNCGIAIDDL